MRTYTYTERVYRLGSLTSCMYTKCILCYVDIDLSICSHKETHTKIWSGRNWSGCLIKDLPRSRKDRTSQAKTTTDYYFRCGIPSTNHAIIAYHCCYMPPVATMIFAVSLHSTWWQPLLTIHRRFRAAPDTTPRFSKRSTWEWRGEAAKQSPLLCFSTRETCELWWMVLVSDDGYHYDHSDYEWLMMVCDGWKWVSLWSTVVSSLTIMINHNLIIRI